MVGIGSALGQLGNALMLFLAGWIKTVTGSYFILFMICGLAYLVALGLVFAFNSLLLGLLLAGTLTLLVGLVDDFGVLTPAAKIAGQAVAVFVLLRSGAVIELAEVPQGLRWPLAALWLFAVCNAFNLLDVMDGLAAGVGAVAGLAFGIVALSTGEYPEAAASLALAGALCGFLVFNVHPARIYLGDAGSLAVGLTLGALAIAIRWSDRSPAGFLAPLAILGVPLADTAYVSILRARAGKPFWHGSSDHFPLRLRAAMGGNVGKAVSTVIALTGVGAAAGVGTTVLWSWQIGLWVLGGYALGLVVLLSLLAHIRMEVPE